MNLQDISSMFEGVSDSWKQLIVRDLKIDLTRAIMGVNEYLQQTGIGKESLAPPVELIMNAFRLCPKEKLKVVIIGQDPYIGQGEAMGLSFSVARGKKVPASLNNIYKCLINNGYIKEAPNHGDLTAWAKQGVLLFNASLTTILGKSNAHCNIWKNYTSEIIRHLSAESTGIIFVLLGKDAQEKKSLIDSRKHHILEWGHPSPLNRANSTDSNPANFKYCDVFTRANDILIDRGDEPINWDPNSTGVDGGGNINIINEVNNVNVNIDKVTDKVIDKITDKITDKINNLVIREDAIEIPNSVINKRAAGLNDPVPVPLGDLWMFTDGGSSANGKANCKASYAYYITDGETVVEESGIVPEANIEGKQFKSSNNRGELMAILRGLQFIRDNSKQFKFNTIFVISDSQYSIGCITIWAENWFSNPTKYKLSEKKNLDLITPAKEAYDSIRDDYRVMFTHVNSHTKAPLDTSSQGWFIWKCNDHVESIEVSIEVKY